MIAIKEMKPYTLRSYACDPAIRKGDEVTRADKDFEF